MRADAAGLPRCTVMFLGIMTLSRTRGTQFCTGSGPLPPAPVKSEVDRRRKAMQELYLDKVSGLIDTVQFSEMNQTFLEDVKNAETRINILEAELEQQQEETSVVQTQMQRVRELAQVSHLTRELAVLLVHRVVVGTKDPLTGEQKITIEWNF